VDDRELLELAAKAHGGIASDGLGECFDMALEKDWNPLTDDGDALRLAVKLKMELDCHLYCASVNYNVWHDADDIGDGEAATRRAIVRAAAEIGKSM